MYSLSYLPGFRKDLEAIVDYITTALEAPKAALDLLDAVEQTCQNLMQFPFAHRLFQFPKPIDTEYRVLPVKNYLVFYTVADMTIEIHRIIYKKRNLPQLITE
ncbi:MAG: type II toxin-antitoxin system RelE/ParE family toxin [Treponema sp.]|jgi:plasmid stabilization system protein ParE|nr:type II toxin-antitoxin system RelE/ParE family toxin [Treponema sp.]